jgi:hypothetical protein
MTCASCRERGAIEPKMNEAINIAKLKKKRAKRSFLILLATASLPLSTDFAGEDAIGIS